MHPCIHLHDTHQFMGAFFKVTPSRAISILCFMHRSKTGATEGLVDGFLLFINDYRSFNILSYVSIKYGRVYAAILVEVD